MMGLMSSGIRDLMRDECEHCCIYIVGYSVKAMMFSSAGRLEPVTWIDPAERGWYKSTALFIVECPGPHRSAITC